MQITDNITLVNALLCLGISALIGVIFALFYWFTKRKVGYDYSYITALVLLPIIVSVIILLVSNDIVKAFSLGGVFVLVRFRTRIRDIRDTVFIFSVIACGFACGLEFYYFAGIIGLFMLIILTILHFTKLDQPKVNAYRLKVLVPENLDYVELFDEAFKEYTSKHVLMKVKLSDFGSIIELTYLVHLKDVNKQKAFIDELRKCNGNLNIVLANDYEKLVNVAD